LLIVHLLPLHVLAGSILPCSLLCPEPLRRALLHHTRRCCLQL
jgi:hypothetical protein